MSIYRFETEVGTKGYVQAEDMAEAELIIREKLDMLFGSIAIECALSSYELSELENIGMVISEW